MWKFLFYIKRIRCLFIGCDEKHESGWNMPDDWRSPIYCNKCGAEDDVYNMTSTPYRLLYTSDGFIERLRQFFVWDK
jgi:hypothetical protein